MEIDFDSSLIAAVSLDVLIRTLPSRVRTASIEVYNPQGVLIDTVSSFSVPADADGARVGLVATDGDRIGRLLLRVYDQTADRSDIAGIDNISAFAVPEPSSGSVILLCLGLSVLRRRRHIQILP